METVYQTITEALNALRSKGYTEDFNLKHDCIECQSRNITLHPEDFLIDELYRFENASDPADNSILYAISGKQGIKGVLVDAFGMYSENMTPEMLQKLKERN